MKRIWQLVQDFFHRICDGKKRWFGIRRSWIGILQIGEMRSSLCVCIHISYVYIYIHDYICMYINIVPELIIQQTGGLNTARRLEWRKTTICCCLFDDLLVLCWHVALVSVNSIKQRSRGSPAHFLDLSPWVLFLNPPSSLISSYLHVCGLDARSSLMISVFVFASDQSSWNCMDKIHMLSNPDVVW